MFVFNKQNIFLFFLIGSRASVRFLTKHSSILWKIKTYYPLEHLAAQRRIVMGSFKSLKKQLRWDESKNGNHFSIKLFQLKMETVSTCPVACSCENKILYGSWLSFLPKKEKVYFSKRQGLNWNHLSSWLATTISNNCFFLIFLLFHFVSENKNCKLKSHIEELFKYPNEFGHSNFLLLFSVNTRTPTFSVFYSSLHLQLRRRSYTWI